MSAVDHVIGIAGPELGNVRGGLLASLAGAPIALVTGGLAAAGAVVCVGALNRPLRRHRTACEQEGQRA